MPMFVGLLRPQRAKHRLARASAALLLAASLTLGLVINRHRAGEGDRPLEAEEVRALGVLLLLLRVVLVSTARCGALSRGGGQLREASRAGDCVGRIGVSGIGRRALPSRI